MAWDDLQTGILEEFGRAAALGQEQLRPNRKFKRASAWSNMYRRRWRKTPRGRELTRLQNARYLERHREQKNAARRAKYARKKLATKLAAC